MKSWERCGGVVLEPLGGKRWLICALKSDDRISRSFSGVILPTVYLSTTESTAERTQEGPRCTWPRKCLVRQQSPICRIRDGDSLLKDQSHYETNDGCHVFRTNSK